MQRHDRRLRGSVGGLGHQSRQTAMFLAAATVPRTFQRSLMPRSNLDQGLITGIATVANYALASVLHDVIAEAGIRVARRIRRGGRTQERRATAAANLSAILLGSAVQHGVRPLEHEHIGRGALRVAGWFFAATGFGGLSVAMLQEGLSWLDHRTAGRYNLESVPVAVPAGAALSTVLEFARIRRANRAEGQNREEGVHISIARSLMAGTGVAAGLTTIALTEHAFATALQHGLENLLPEAELAARPLANAVTIAGLVAAVYAGLQWIYVRIETAAAVPEPGFDQPPACVYMSGCAESGVAFDSLTQYPRRHVLTYERPEWIEQVMEEPAQQHPIRVYVGLDSAPTIAERVSLALTELERTGAFDRSLLVLISPTGTGWINPVAIAAVEFFARGDVASVALQYSKRPSPLSLGRIALGREQNRLLWSSIHQRLYERPPERRPRIVLFGESLGAHTSQDVFIHQGTTGLSGLGIDAALWLGTPHASEWKEEVLGISRPDVDRSLVAVFDNFGQFEALSEAQRSRLRYIMLTHENDATAYFGVDLLLSEPAWLGRRRPPAVPAENRYLPIPTFLQTAIDMKNAMNPVPGIFVAWGHDYRADLARFINAIYRFDVTERQLERIEHALRRQEVTLMEYVNEHRRVTDTAP